MLKIDLDKILITNICAKINFECKLNLKIIRSEDGIFNNFNYDPSVFSALRFGYKNSKIKILLFSNGRTNIIGAKTIGQIDECVKNLMFLLKNYDPVQNHFEIYNICTSINLSCKIDLVKLAKFHKKYASYEPELFAGIVFDNGKKLKFMIHRTGIIFATGFKSMKEIHIEYYKLFEKINMSNCLKFE